MKRWMVLCLLACACGSDSGSPDGGTSGGSGSITGTVGGHPLSVKDAVFAIDSSTKIVTVVVADRANICTLLSGTTLPSGTTTVLGFALLNYPGGLSAADVVTGDYTWYDLQNLTGAPPPGKYWNGAFVIPTSCTAASSTNSTGGSVSVTQVGTTTGTHLKVTLNNAAFGVDALNGSIEAVYCEAVNNPTCGSGLVYRPGASE